MFRSHVLAAALAAALALSACAPSIPVQSAQLLPLTSTQPRMRLTQNVVLKLSTGYSRRLASGSLWRPVGQVPQGLVLQPVGTVLTIEGRQVHEAYLVVSQNAVVGFYLPGESRFSPLAPSQPITIEGIND